MSDAHEIVTPEEIEIVPEDTTTLHPLVSMLARSGDPDARPIDELRELMSMQREYDALQAKKAYDSARQRMMADMPTAITADREVRIPRGAQYRYASIGQIMRSVTPVLSRHGFTVSWRTDHIGKEIAVTCVLSHSGHDERCSRQALPDAQGGKSPVQASQSTVTYLQRHTLLSLLGLVTTDAPDADDRPDAVDPARINKAVAALLRHGIGIDEAVEHLDGRPVDQWTLANIQALKIWVTKRNETEDEVPK